MRILAKICQDTKERAALARGVGLEISGRNTYPLPDQHHTRGKSELQKS